MIYQTNEILNFVFVRKIYVLQEDKSLLAGTIFSWTQVI